MAESLWPRASASLGRAAAVGKLGWQLRVCATRSRRAAHWEAGMNDWSAANRVTRQACLDPAATSTALNSSPCSRRPAAECEVQSLRARPNHISWGRLLQRVFDIGMQHSPNCGAGGLKIIAAFPGATDRREDPDAPGPGPAALSPRAGACDRARRTPPGPRRPSSTPHPQTAAPKCAAERRCAPSGRRVTEQGSTLRSRPQINAR